MTDDPTARSPSGLLDARTRAATMLRRLGHALMSHDVDDDLLDGVAAAADRATREVEAAPPRERDLVELKRRMFEIDVADGEWLSHFDECFVSGRQNPLGIAIAVRREGEEAVAEVTLGPAFEGAPGRSHGGIVAAVLDDVMGYILTLMKEPAFTGELTIRYLAPTPIGLPLQFRARLVDRDGRKLHVTAEAYADGHVVASARAVFIAVEPERIRG